MTASHSRAVTRTPHALGVFFLRKWQARAAEAGVFTAALQLRKQGVPVDIAVSLLARRRIDARFVYPRDEVAHTLALDRWTPRDQRRVDAYNNAAAQMDLQGYGATLSVMRALYSEPRYHETYRP